MRAIFVIALAALTLGLASCSEDSKSRERNATLDSVSTPATCTSGGTVSSIDGQQFICAVTKMGMYWYPVAKQKKWLCAKLGGARFQGEIYSVCGKAGKKKYWSTTLPLSPEAIASGFSSSNLTALIDAGDVQPPS